MKGEKKQGSEMDTLYDLGQVEKNIQLETIYKKILPYIDGHYGELVSAHILLILKLEGIIGKTVSHKDYKMVEDIKKKLLGDSDLKSDLIKNIKNIMGEHR